MNTDLWKTLKTCIFWLAALIVLVVSVAACQSTDWYKAKEHADALKEQRDRTPYKISDSVDGCTVYTFKDSGNWHYFTRCATTTTTEKNWTESCGKNCTKKKQEIIVTQNKDTQ